MGFWVLGSGHRLQRLWRALHPTICTSLFPAPWIRGGLPGDGGWARRAEGCFPTPPWYPPLRAAAAGARGGGSSLRQAGGGTGCGRGGPGLGPRPRPRHPGKERPGGAKCPARGGRGGHVSPGAAPPASGPEPDPAAGRPSARRRGAGAAVPCCSAPGPLPQPVLRCSEPPAGAAARPAGR